MPRYDGTGPGGMGPMTGWGRGLCRTSGIGRAFGFRPRLGRRLGSRGPGFGLYGRGRGYGRGFSEFGGFGGAVGAQAEPYIEPASADEERDLLRQQLEAIEDHLTQIRARLGSERTPDRT